MKLVKALILAAAMVVHTTHGDRFSFEETALHLVLKEEGQTVLVFNHGEIEPPEQGVARSGYVHPLLGVDGDRLTDDFPADHRHHRGVFFAWPAMTVLGKQVDVWHMRGIRPIFEKWGHRETSSDAATFRATNLWRLADGDQAAVREDLRYTVYSSGPHGRFIDVEGVFTNLTAEPIVLRGSPQSAYGGLNIRMDGERPDVQITTNQGRMEGNVNAVEPPTPWADHSSRPAADKAHSGVAIFQQPGNPDFPARNWTLRPYGFLGAAWPGERSFELPAGESLTLRYRLFVHRGTAEEAKVAEQFAEFLQQHL